MDFDHLPSFRDSFKFPVIFFISQRSRNNQESSFTNHLDDPNSILHRIQDALVCANQSESYGDQVHVRFHFWSNRNFVNGYMS